MRTHAMPSFEFTGTPYIAVFVWIGIFSLTVADFHRRWLLAGL